MDRKHKNKIILSGAFLVLLLFTLASAGNLLVNIESDIIFSHKFHIEDMEVECTSCHIDIETSNLSSDRNLPSMDECSSCHDVHNNGAGGDSGTGLLAMSNANSDMCLTCHAK